MPYNPNVDLVVGIFLIMAPLLIVGWLVLAVILVGKPVHRKSQPQSDQKPPATPSPATSDSTCSLLERLDQIENDLRKWSSNGDPETAQIAGDMLQSCLAARARLSQIYTGRSREVPKDPSEPSH